MAGWGSGWRGTSAPTAESLRQRRLDLASLKQRGLEHERDQVSVAGALIELKFNGLHSALQFARQLNLSAAISPSLPVSSWSPRPLPQNWLNETRSIIWMLSTRDPLRNTD